MRSSTSPNFTILGIDPGLARLGWGVIRVSGPSFTLHDYGVIETKSTQLLADRIMAIYSELNLIIKKFNPDKVAIEKLFFGKNAKTAMSVGEARGVIILAFSLNKLSYTEFSPAEIKIAVTGYGNADKQQVQRMVQKSLHLAEIPKPDDAADALAVAITGAVTREVKSLVQIKKQ